MAKSLYAHMVQEYYVARLRELAARRAARLAAIRTAAQARAWQAQVRRRLGRIFGPWPRRTPLEARVTGTLRRRDYTIERVLFASRPGYFVTANLYLPRRRGPFPAVLGTCGHAEEGKALPYYQAFARTLAEQGYAVLIYDPVSQGERHQYDHLPKAQRFTGCVREHNMAGNQLALMGEFFGTWRVWDGVRALDYLLSRPEVDATRVGVTGNSGGGTLTTYLTALDGRFTMAAPGCFVTTYLRNLENELPADSEQNPPGMLAAGLDEADFFIARAPRPVLLMGQRHDYFDERGLRQTFAEVRRVYALLGAPDSAQLYIGPGAHGFQPDARQAMYKFFNAVAGVRGSARESGRPLEKEADLYAAPGGQVGRVPGSRYIHEIIKDRAVELVRRRPALNAQEVVATLPSILNLGRRAGAQMGPPHYRVLRPIEPALDRQGGAGARALRASVFAVETQPGIQVILYQWERAIRGKTPAWRSQPDPAREVTLYVPHLSSEDDAADAHLPIGPAGCWSVDLRGLGRTAPLTCGDPGALSSYGQEFFYASHGIMLNESLVGRRAHDLLCTLDLLGARGAQRVHLVARGMGTIPATFAACLHPLVKRVSLRNGLRSFFELTQAPVYAWPLSAMPWGLLAHLDLADCVRALRAKGVRVMVVGAWGKGME